jgi:hypothetical protein
MTDTTTNEKTKRPQVALRDWIDADGKPIDAGDESKAVGLRYVHLPSVLRANPDFNPETDIPPADCTFEFRPTNQTAIMLAIFGGLTLAGNVVNTATNGPKGDKSLNPIPLVAERFAEIENGTWAEGGGAGGGVRYDKAELAKAIAQAKGEQDPAPYLAKMETKVDQKTGATVPSDTKGAISYGAFALRNAKVKAEYDALTGGGVELGAL